MITFKDFKNKRAELKVNRNQYKELILTSINNFIEIYINSLDLPAESFQTEGYTHHPYVYVINENDRWGHSFDNLVIDKVNGATFELYTVVDDEPPLPRPVVTRINVHVMDGKLVYVLLADNQNNNVSVTIDSSDDLIAFSEMVKRSIILKIESEPLGKKTKVDESVKLWD
ncbi:hypothetical protein JW310_06885 [Enterobacter cloacae subsp. cloacae]|uniref:hypothetical protein n=1 Tax=Enterobacter cloacae TaxID=550 RepID=UPI000750C6CE|nr:hypothetical protein [Enterobacter cloacae]MBW4196366.1 hypothetical protein [Enterobacter cloacae subsp. cloacae]